MRKGKFLYYILILSVLICGCGRENVRMEESDSAQTAPIFENEKDLKPIRVAVQEYYISSLIGYIMDHELDEMFGLKVEPVLYSSGAEQIVDVDKDVYDVATIGASFLYPLIEDKAVLIGEHIKCTGGNAIYAEKGSPILEVRGFNPIYPEVYGDPETLKGCTILMKENTTSQYLGMKWLESIGVKTDAVHIEYVDFEQMYAELSQGNGDAAVLVAPTSYQAEKDGYVQVASTDTLFINTYEVIIATNEAYREKQEELVQFLQLLLYAGEQLEKDFSQKVEACGSWYERNDVDFTKDILKQECEDKIFVTRENYEIEGFGEFEYKYAEYMAATGNIPAAQLKNVKENMDSELFCQALGAE